MKSTRVIQQTRDGKRDPRNIQRDRDRKAARRIKHAAQGRKSR